MLMLLRRSYCSRVPPGGAAASLLVSSRCCQQHFDKGRDHATTDGAAAAILRRSCWCDAARAPLRSFCASCLSDATHNDEISLHFPPCGFKYNAVLAHSPRPPPGPVIYMKGYHFGREKWRESGSAGGDWMARAQQRSRADYLTC